MGCGKSITAIRLISISDLKKEKEKYLELQNSLTSFTSQQDFIKDLKNLDLKNFNNEVNELSSKYNKDKDNNEKNILEKENFTLLIKHFLSIDIIRDHMNFIEKNLETELKYLIDKNVFFNDEKDKEMCILIKNNIKRMMSYTQTSIDIKTNLLEKIYPLDLEDISIHLKFSSTLSPNSVNLYFNDNLSDSTIKNISKIIYSTINLKSLFIWFDKKENFKEEELINFDLIFLSIRDNPGIVFFCLNSEYIDLKHSIWEERFVDSICLSSVEILVLNKCNFSSGFWKKFIKSLKNYVSLRYLFINSNDLTIDILESIVQFLVESKMIGVYFSGFDIKKDFYDKLLMCVSKSKEKFKFFGFIKDFSI